MKTVPESGSWNLYSTLLGGLLTLLGGYLAHRFYISRWHIERRESYKTELFKLKLEAYRELLRLYFELVLKTIECSIKNLPTKAFLQKKREVDDFIKRNYLIISKEVAALAVKSHIDEVQKGQSIGDVVRITLAQHHHLANACRRELGIEAISDDIEKTFPAKVVEEIIKKTEQSHSDKTDQQWKQDRDHH